MKETMIAKFDDVRELGEGEPTELWTSPEGRVVIRAYNECGNNYTEVDVLALFDRLRGAELEGLEDARIAALSAFERD